MMTENLNEGERAIRIAEFGSVQRLLACIVFAVIVGSGTVPTSAVAQGSGDRIRGEALAESWCQSCHIIDKRGTGRAVDPAPPFPMIASDPGKTPGYLQQWLSTSHPQMPDFNLGRRDITDLIAYIRSLAPPPVKGR